MIAQLMGGKIGEACCRSLKRARLCLVYEACKLLPCGGLRLAGKARGSLLLNIQWVYIAKRAVAACGSECACSCHNHNCEVWRLAGS